MRISNNKVVTLEYAVRDEQGHIIDDSQQSGTMSYVHGRGRIIRGLEEALSGRPDGDSFSVVVPPAKGFGERDASKIHEFTRKELAHLGDLKVGMKLRIRDASGAWPLTVARLDDDKVALDENHPLAGRALRFDVHVLAVRDATPEELESGEAHDASCREDCSTCAAHSVNDGHDGGCGCGCSCG